MSAGRVSEVRVRTPEGVLFAFPLAGPATRFLARFIDGLIIYAAAMAAQFLFVFFSWISTDVATAAFLVAFFVFSTGYGVVMEWRWRGQTIGKRCLRLRVMDENGLPLTFSQVLLRNLLRLVDSPLPMFHLIGGAVMLANRRAQRLGDIAAGTIVIRQPRLREPDFGELFAGRYNSLRELPHLAARLRQLVPPELAAAAVGALLRREELEPTARVVLFADLAAGFRRLVSYPPEIVAGMPDVAYVR
jgi:uncharacterized RDD family membrane protein YckC